MEPDNIGWLGPFGNLRPFPCLPADIQTRVERPNFRGTTITGRPYTQQAPRSGRVWQWPIELGDPDTLRELQALESLAYGPPPFNWYDPWAAGRNLLKPGLAVPGSVFDLDGWHIADDNEPFEIVPGPLSPVDGFTFGSGVSFNGSILGPAGSTLEVAGLRIDPIPAIPGRSYTISAYGLKTTGAGTWGPLAFFVDATGTAIGLASDVVATDPNPQRAVGTAVAPAGTAGIAIQFSSAEQMDWLTGLQLTEGDTEQKWYPGIHGTLVSIPEGYGETLARVTQSDCFGEKRGMNPLTLVEVG